MVKLGHKERIYPVTLRIVITAALFVFVFTASDSKALDEIFPLKTPWQYYVAGFSGYGCHETEIELVDAILSEFESYGSVCHAEFRGWTGDWPIGETVSSYHDTCPPWPTFGPQERFMPTRAREELRVMEYAISSASACEIYSDQLFGLNRSFIYYCPKGYSLGYPTNYSGGPYVPVCVLPPGSPDPDKNQGPPECGAFNPISVATGNKYQEGVDYKSDRMDGLSFIRIYNGLKDTVVSATQYSRATVGALWQHNYDRWLAFNDTSSIPGVTLYRGNGKVLHYHDTGNQLVSDPDVIAQLDRLYDSGGLPVGWRYITSNNEIEQYDAEGRLTSMSSPTRQAQTLSYDGSNRLLAVSDAFGGQLTFTYDASNRLATMTDPGGGVYHYGYDTDDNLISVTYPDDTPGDLTDNPTRQYLYEDSRFPHALTGIVDENGERYATWTYDDQGRAISSSHANGADSGTLSYNADGTTTVTNALGKQTTYHFDIIHGVYKVTQVEGHPTASCAGANQAYTYDTNGFLASKTDWNGHVTTYVHDDRGLETTRTEGAGTPQARTVTTEWHTDFRLPVRITEPDKVTEFSYDTNGRLLDKQERSAQ